jgi:hypothetical protein
MKRSGKHQMEARKALMWKEIADKSDIDEIMEAFGDFHDTCIQDAYISTGEFVDGERSMHFDNPLTISLLFQRQSRKNPVLELKFESVRMAMCRHIRRRWHNRFHNSYNGTCRCQCGKRGKSVRPVYKNDV